MRFELAKEESTVESFEHFVGVKYTDDELLLEFITTRIVVLKGLIVAYRAPVNSQGSVGFEEKSPIHIADVVRMIEWSTSRLKFDESELNPARPVRSVLKSGNRHEATMASHPAGSKKKVSFELQ